MRISDWSSDVCSSDLPAPAPPAAPSPGASGSGIEQWLTSRGLIWLGGATLALAGLFLAKYTYDHGWLAVGPAGRVASGFLFGVAQIGRAHVELQSLMRISSAVFCLKQKQ